MRVITNVPPPFVSSRPETHSVPQATLHDLSTAERHWSGQPSSLHCTYLHAGPSPPASTPTATHLHLCPRPFDPLPPPGNLPFVDPPLPPGPLHKPDGLIQASRAPSSACASVRRPATSERSGGGGTRSSGTHSSRSVSRTESAPRISSIVLGASSEEGGEGGRERSVEWRRWRWESVWVTSDLTSKYAGGSRSGWGKGEKEGQGKELGEGKWERETHDRGSS